MEKNEQKEQKLAEFQDVFQNVFRKLKKQNDLFPKTKYNLADGHILILLYLSKKGRCTASEVTTYLGITSGGGTVLTSTLFKHHLIDRVRLESDRRVIQLSLTEEGKKVVNEVIKQRAEAFIELFRDMKDEEIDQVTNVFKKLDNLLT
ncbi:hypothetical protein SFC65_21665 [Priestia filamentosa]|uniref:MarR family winged helix-turn-helix transcriptional regulator n=1 Tax=Priestia filamentosa TaxID=1402861 RepID=UPI0002E503E5|nr:hypothetical protein [Priestia filamentosa]